MHHRVHNVLEAAVRGLYLSFGPRYHTSAEAVHLVELGLAKVCESCEELQTWWQKLPVSITGENEELAAEVERLSGASASISSEILKRIRISE